MENLINNWDAFYIALSLFIICIVGLIDQWQKYKKETSFENSIQVDDWCRLKYEEYRDQKMKEIDNMINKNVRKFNFKQKYSV